MQLKHVILIIKFKILSNKLIRQTNRLIKKIIGIKVSGKPITDDDLSKINHFVVCDILPIIWQIDNIQRGVNSNNQKELYFENGFFILKDILYPIIYNYKELLIQEPLQGIRDIRRQ